MHRQVREPHQCLKCQKIGVAHSAAECKSEVNVCSTCAKGHRTAECLNNNNSALLHCGACQSAGHAAWDCNCPSFVEQACRLNTRFPENAYKFFVSRDPSTWVLTNQAQITQRAPPAPSYPAQPHRQTTGKATRQGQHGKSASVPTGDFSANTGFIHPSRRDWIISGANSVAAKNGSTNRYSVLGSKGPTPGSQSTNATQTTLDAFNFTQATSSTTPNQEPSSTTNQQPDTT